MNALCVFLVELTRDAIQGADATLLSMTSLSDGVHITTDHGTTLHRVYWHVGMVHGLRDWWS